MDKRHIMEVYHPILLLNTPCSKVLNVIIHTRGAEIEDAKNHGVFLSSRALEKHYDILDEVTRHS